MPHEDPPRPAGLSHTESFPMERTMFQYHRARLYGPPHSSRTVATVAMIAAFAAACSRTERAGRSSDSGASAQGTAAKAPCPTNNDSLALPAGFCATVFAD